VSQVKNHLLDDERKKEHQKIAEWLSPADYSSQQNDYFSRRVVGTGEWLLCSDEFQTWRNGRNENLFCPGMPGAGKTILSSIVIEHLLDKFQNDTNVGIAYMYCTYRQHEEYKPEDFLLSLLRQLFQDPHTASAKALCSRHESKRSRPTLEEIKEALHSTIQSYQSQVFVIIDALDESHGSSEGRDKLLTEILDLQEKTPINLFITSRRIPEIELLLRRKDFVQKDIVANEEDVLKYLDTQIPQLLKRRISKDLELQMEIRESVIKAMDGM
jgi:Cdc6-like AAA superfamily ATPase